jgi:hypothetical protein
MGHASTSLKPFLLTTNRTDSVTAANFRLGGRLGPPVRRSIRRGRDPMVGRSAHRDDPAGHDDDELTRLLALPAQHPARRRDDRADCWAADSWRSSSPEEGRTAQPAGRPVGVVAHPRVLSPDFLDENDMRQALDGR